MEQKWIGIFSTYLPLTRQLLKTRTNIIFLSNQLAIKNGLEIFQRIRDGSKVSLIKPNFDDQLFVDLYVLYVFWIWNCSEKNNNNFGCNTIVVNPR